MAVGSGSHSLGGRICRRILSGDTSFRRTCRDYSSSHRGFTGRSRICPARHSGRRNRHNSRSCRHHRNRYCRRTSDYGSGQRACVRHREPIAISHHNSPRPLRTKRFLGIYIRSQFRHSKASQPHTPGHTCAHSRPRPPRGARSVDALAGPRPRIGDIPALRYGLSGRYGNTSTQNYPS